MYYFGINDLEKSLLRVQRRVLLGGHNVSDDVVRYNFTEGVKRAKENLHLFDYMTFIDGIIPYGKVIANIRRKDNYKILDDNLPKWFINNFAERI